MIKLKVISFSHKILISIRNYCSIVWQNANNNPVMVQVLRNDQLNTYFLNSFWAGVLALVAGMVIGVFLGILVGILILVYHWIVFQFGFKAIYPNGRWKDYIEYRQNRDNRAYFIQTRGGAINLDDILNAIDDSSNGINPIIEFLKNQCFRKPGFYRVKPSKWDHVIKRLKKLGLLKWIFVGGKKIGIVSLDSFLLQVLNLSSLSFQLPLLGSLSLSIFEISKAKLLFNILGLAALIGVSSFVLFFGCIHLIALNFGLTSLAAISAEQASIGAMSLIATMTVYVVGQFAPPNCSNLAEYLKDANVVDGQIRIRRSDFELGNNDKGGVIVYSPPPITEIELVDNPVDLPVPDHSFLKDPYFRNYSPRKQVKNWKDLFEQIDTILEEIDMEDLDFTSPTPTYVRFREGLAEFLEEGGGLE